MMNPTLGKLRRVDDLRIVWKNEASQFTPWLADNLPLLNGALGLEIELVQREMPVGDFAVDVFGKEVGSGREVIIENQLEPTDHNHLGQLLTYAAVLEAKIVVWISPTFRDEHRQAIDWLNLHTREGVDFFGVELELLQIDDSLPAPHFKVVAQPNEWQKQVAIEAKTGPSDRGKAYHDFFVDLLNRLKARNPGFTSATRVGYDSWIGFGAGRTGFTLYAEFLSSQNRFLVDLWVDLRDYNRNKRVFDLLFKQRTEVESELGEALSWEPLKRTYRIAAEQKEVNINSPSQTLDQMKDWAVEELIKFRGAFEPKVRALDLASLIEEEPSTDDRPTMPEEQP